MAATSGGPQALSQPRWAHLLRTALSVPQSGGALSLLTGRLDVGPWALQEEAELAQRAAAAMGDIRTQRAAADRAAKEQLLTEWEVHPGRLLMGGLRQSPWCCGWWQIKRGNGASAQLMTSMRVSIGAG